MQDAALCAGLLRAMPHDSKELVMQDLGETMCDLPRVMTQLQRDYGNHGGSFNVVFMERITHGTLVRFKRSWRTSVGKPQDVFEERVAFFDAASEKRWDMIAS